MNRKSDFDAYMRRRLGLDTAKKTPPAEQTPLPPRRLKHGSERIRLTRWFYMTLIALFVMLTIGLIWWGQKLTGGIHNDAAVEAGVSSVRILPGSRNA
jgi:hypothetical protein